MSTRATLEELFDTKKQRCFACGSGEWRGFWRGTHGDVFVCAQCAQEVLPRLIADATWHDGTPQYSKIEYMEHVLSHVMMEFWRAVSVRATRPIRTQIPDKIIGSDSGDGRPHETDA